MSGKGSKQRPTNKEAFDANFERIFGNTKPKANKKEKPKNDKASR